MSINEKIKEPPEAYHYQRPESIKSWRADVSEALYDAGLDKVADRWLTCSENPITKINAKSGAKIPANAEMLFVCSGNHMHDAEVVAQSCDLRICPDCARRHSARLAARYTPKMLELLHQHHPTYRFRLVTFTLPYPLTDPDIREKYLRGFDQVAQVMDGIMSETSPDWKSKQGYIVAAEFGAEGYKLHYHCIHYGQYLPQGDLKRRWIEATDKAAEIVDVRSLFRKSESLEKNVKEVFKYAVKFFSKDKITGEVKCIPAEFVPMLARVLSDTRRVRAHGVFFNIPEPQSEIHSCSSCGEKMVGIPVSYFETYCNTGLLPNEYYRRLREAVLPSKPADKSPTKSTASPPPDPIGSRTRQMQMDFVKKLRWQRKDEF